MSTISPVHNISTALFGKTQRAPLGLLFVRPEQSFYLRQIVRTAEIGHGAALQCATTALATCGYRASREAYHYRVIQSLAYTIGVNTKAITNGLD